MIKGSIHQEYITVIKTYASEIEPPNTWGNRKVEENIDNLTIMVRDFNTLLSIKTGQLDKLRTKIWNT